MRPQGSPAELERRRFRAIDLLQRDVPVHAVAERLGVDRRSVRRWKRAHRGHGRAGLRARPASGRPPKLTAAQRGRLARLVVRDPKRLAMPRACGPAGGSSISSATTSRSSTIRITSDACCEPVASVRSVPSPARRSATIAACASGFSRIGPG
jgi:transposase-like protein